MTAGNSALLALADVSKSFGGLRALQGCSFAVREGSITGLVGANGAGKTTAFNLITGVLRPDTGEITFRGRSIARLSAQARVRLGIGRTFQDVRLFPGLSALDNVAVGVPAQPGDRLTNVFLRPVAVRRRERQDRRTARQCLEEVGFDETKLSARAAELGYGEQKLLSLARLLALGARLLLLDEPASGLDGSSIVQLQGIVRSLAEGGRTVLLVEHNILLVRELCDHALFLNQGRVLAEGAPADLMNDERLQAAYLGAPVTGGKA